MKNNLTELVFILDRSGSMSGMESDTIGGYNGMLEKQKKEPGEAIVTTVLFDDQYELLHDRINLRGVVPITEREYYVRGTTALLDAVGRTINKIGNAQMHTAEEERADRVLFVITTDGRENASREFKYDQVRQMIAHQKSKYNWEFIFFGADIDAVTEAARFGIRANRAVQFVKDRKGMESNYEMMNEAISEFRSSETLSDDWKKPVDKKRI